MKNWRNSVFGSILFWLAVMAMPGASFAAFSSGSTGADGDLAPSGNTVLQVPENGVFNYKTVNIPTGVTVTFTKNSANTPVTILASGDVRINGTISVNGSAGNNVSSGAGGPGGYDGGGGGYVNTSGSRGNGPGGGVGSGYTGGGGGYGAAGSSGGTTNIGWGSSCGCTTGPGGGTYGNVSLVPLLGGSGGGGGGGNTTSYGGGGGGGGGSLLIASSGTITVASGATVSANGGNGAHGNSNYGGGGGSGGSIRLVANVITGEGNITATGGGSNQTGNYGMLGGTGGVGRIRLEAWQISRSSSTSPSQSTYTYPETLYPPIVPSLAITQVNGQNVSVTPTGALRSPDVILPYNSPTPVIVTVTAINVPIAGKTVTVKALPEAGNNVITATGPLTGTDSSSIAQISLPISSSVGYVLSASVNY